MKIKIAAILILFSYNALSFTPDYNEIPSAEDIPIIDGHLHLFRDVDADHVREKFKEFNVVKAVWFPRGFGSRGSKGIQKGKDLDFAKSNPDLGYVLAGLQKKFLHKEKFGTSNWTDPHKKWKPWLRDAQSKVLNGDFAGYGELIIRHYSYNQGKGERDYPIDSVVFTDLLRASNESKKPFVIHAEGEDHIVKDLLEQLPKYPNAKVIWAHACGRSNPTLVHQWLLKNPNLYCDLANMTDTGHYGSLWPRHGEWTYRFEKNGEILPDWLTVVEALPSRFYIGSDVNEGVGWDKLVWQERIIRFRKLLAQLSPNAREWLAWKTVETLYSD